MNIAAVVPATACLVLIIGSVGLLSGCQHEPAPTMTGLEVLAAENFEALRGRRVAVVTNQTGVDGDLRGLTELIAAAPHVQLVALFSPEHGFRGAAAAGAHVADGREAATAVPVYSLYGKVRRPTSDMLTGVDVVLFDIQDVGVRTYTYLATLKEVLYAAAANGVEVWVLDRPVPIGGETIEGPVSRAEFESFVAPHPVALRHGMTAGEFARMLNDERRIGADLRVVRMSGYRRGAQCSEDGKWIAPSPNIPTRRSAFAYAATVLVEGTNLSEGRGTTRPFELIGAPWLDGVALAQQLNALRLPGCRFRAVTFRPWFSKYRGEDCEGVQLHIDAPQRFRAAEVAVALLSSVQRLHPDEFEFDADRFDRLAGSSALRTMVVSGEVWRKIAASWSADLDAFRARRARFLLYQ